MHIITNIPPDPALDGIITEPLIRDVIHTFYARVRQDAVLGPIFESRIGNEWDAHLVRMVDFWSTILLKTGRYTGRPLELHRPLPIGHEHFTRWLHIFKNTVNELCTEPCARIFIDRSERIATSLQAGIGITPPHPSHNEDKS